MALLALAQQADLKKQQADLEAARRLTAERAQAEAESARRQQLELTKQSQALRAKAEADAKSRDEASRRNEAAQKQQAAERLRAEAAAATRKGDYPQAFRTLQSAAALNPSATTLQELAQAKAKSEEAARQRTVADSAQRAAETKRLADAAAAKIADERRRRDADEAQRRKMREEQDLNEQQRLVGVAKQALGKGQFDAARSALDSARALKATEEVAKLSKEVQDARALAAATAQGAAAQRDAEKRLADEKARTAKIEADTKQKQTTYEGLLRQAQQALADKKYDQAKGAYQEAGKLFRTDAVLTGLQEAERRLATNNAAQQADAKARLEDAKRQEDFKRLVSAGGQAMTLKKYDEAEKAYTDALRLQPGDPAATAALRQATQARLQAVPEPKVVPKVEPKVQTKAELDNAKRQEDFKRLITRGRPGHDAQEI